MTAKKKKKQLTPRERQNQRRRKWWAKHKKEENTKRRAKWKTIKEEKNRERREKYQALDLETVNQERRQKYWGGEIPIFPKKKSLATTTKTTTTTTKQPYCGLRGKRPPKILPSRELLQQIWDYIKNAEIPNHPNNKRKYYKCVFRLCWKSGLRISEAINFDWSFQHSEHQNLYLLRGKGQKDRWVSVDDEVIRELKVWDWKANKITRQCYSRFLRLVKKKLNIAENIQLEPHSLRRAFATHNAINGVPLPLIQQQLGHFKISTTAIYIKEVGLANLAKCELI